MIRDSGLLFWATLYIACGRGSNRYPNTECDIWRITTSRRLRASSLQAAATYVTAAVEAANVVGRVCFCTKTPFTVAPVF